jgi:hypothetical protein
MNGIEMIEFVMRAIPKEIMCGEGDGCILALLQLRSAVTDYPLLELRVTKRLICNFAAWIKCTFKFQSSLLSVVAASIRTQPDYFSANLGVQGLLDVLRSCFMDQSEGQKCLSTSTKNKTITKNKTRPSVTNDILNLSNLVHLELNPPVGIRNDPENDFLIHDDNNLRENGIGLKSVSQRHSFFNLFQAELLAEDISGDSNDVKSAHDGRHIEIDEYNPDPSDAGDLGDNNNDKIDDNSDKNDSNNNVDIIPDEVILSDVISGDSILSDGIPDDSIPGDSISGDLLPDDFIPDNLIPGDSNPVDSIPGGAIPDHDQISDRIMNKDVNISPEGDSDKTKHERKLCVDTEVTANVNAINGVLDNENKNIESINKENLDVTPMTLNRQQKTHLRGSHLDLSLNPLTSTPHPLNRYPSIPYPLPLSPLSRTPPAF